MTEDLTPLQRQQLVAKMDLWRDRARSTAPLDRQAASLAIGAVYALIGEPQPQRVFFSSPAACLLAWGLLRASRPDDVGLGSLKDRIYSQIPTVLRGPAQSFLPLPPQEPQLPGLIRRRGASLLVAQSSPPPPWDSALDEEGRAVARLRSRWVRQLEERSRLLLQPAQACLRDSLEAWRGLDTLLEQVWQQLQLHSPLIRGSWARLRRRVAQTLTAQMAGQVAQMLAGPFECFPEVVDDYLQLHGTSVNPEHQVLRQIWLDLGRECGWWLPLPGLALVSERPCRLSVDALGELHHDSLAAIEYRDGYGIYALHGIPVPSHLITGPLMFEHIESEPVLRVQQLMLERYGVRRYFLESQPEVVDCVPLDHPIAGLRGARLLRKAVRGLPEPLVFLEMVNSTPGPDGSSHRYLERIDPHAYHGDASRLCHAAMASRWFYRDESGELLRTFERWQDYQPSGES